MKVSEFKKMLAGLADDAELLFSSDEELNCLRQGGEVASLDGKKKKIYAVYGFDGTEVEINVKGELVWPTK
jgi:hypothetical protein